MNDNARMYQIVTWPKSTSSASVNAEDICTTCDASSSFLRSRRSATTPPMRVKRSSGASPTKLSSARYQAESVSSRTSQLCATFCIQVPMLDVQAPIHSTRKSR
jgi:hypothetical protein